MISGEGERVRGHSGSQEEEEGEPVTGPRDTSKARHQLGLGSHASESSNTTMWSEILGKPAYGGEEGQWLREPETFPGGFLAKM